MLKRMSSFDTLSASIRAFNEFLWDFSYDAVRSFVGWIFLLLAMDTPWEPFPNSHIIKYIRCIVLLSVRWEAFIVEHLPIRALVVTLFLSLIIFWSTEKAH